MSEKHKASQGTHRFGIAGVRRPYMAAAHHLHISFGATLVLSLLLLSSFPPGALAAATAGNRGKGMVTGSQNMQEVHRSIRMLKPDDPGQRSPYPYGPGYRHPTPVSPVYQRQKQKQGN
ncbi:hypothetical protein BS78_04G072100 [Paspalum vaginatum]|nr:hypothetical protein BS78_04G072100 [Paspalum vaginatum]